MVTGTENQNDQLTLAEQILDEVFDVELENRLSVVGQYIERIDGNPELTGMTTVRTALEAMGNFFLGVNQMRGGNFVQAYELINLAVTGLNQVGLKDFAHVATAMLTYAEAIVNIQQLNLGKALELFTKGKQQLSNASRYGQEFQALIDHFEPEALFIAMVTALNQSDYPKAKALASQTFKAGQNVAEEYYKEPEPLYYTFKGLAHYYRSFYTFSQALADFHRFQFQEIAAQKDLSADAAKARELLSKGDLSSIIMQRNLLIADSIDESLCVLSEMAAHTGEIFTAAAGLDVYNPALVEELKAKAQRAVDIASEAGPEMLRFARCIENIRGLVEGLDDLMTRPAGPKKRAAMPPGQKVPPAEANIFLVHGHDHGTKETVARFLERLDLKVTILQDEPTRGQTILEKLIDYAGQSTYAIVLLTADDRGGVKTQKLAEQQMRARQNVIFELGYFLAALGRGHVCAIHQEGVEVPSDYHGIIYVSLDKGDSWKLRVAREIKASGIDIDLNKAI